MHGVSVQLKGSRAQSQLNSQLQDLIQIFVEKEYGRYLPPSHSVSLHGFRYVSDVNSDEKYYMHCTVQVRALNPLKEIATLGVTLVVNAIKGI